MISTVILIALVTLTLELAKTLVVMVLLINEPLLESLFTDLSILDKLFLTAGILLASLTPLFNQLANLAYNLRFR